MHWTLRIPCPLGHAAAGSPCDSALGTGERGSGEQTGP